MTTHNPNPNPNPNPKPNPNPSSNPYPLTPSPYPNQVPIAGSVGYATAVAQPVAALTRTA